MSAIDTLFTNLKADGKKAFMPFITAGDPDLAFSAAVLERLAAAGSHMCEVGIPYSDPVADGPAIQASYTRALASGVNLDGIFNMLAGVDTPAPVVTMVSYAIVHRRGIEQYVAAAKAAGVSGAIVPDLLVEEAPAMAEVCKREDFSLIQLVTPTTPRDRAMRIAETSTGFLYYVSVTGITGEREGLPADVVDNVGWLREQSPLPVCIGFGISQPQHVSMLAPAVDGVIVGSAIVRRIAKAADQPREAVLDDVEQYARSLIAAL